jgi:hypothetical protein
VNTTLQCDSVVPLCILVLEYVPVLSGQTDLADWYVLLESVQSITRSFRNDHASRAHLEGRSSHLFEQMVCRVRAPAGSSDGGS